MEAAERDDVRAVVLYGGERVFAAGADIKAMSAARRRGHGRVGPRAARTPSPPSPASRSRSSPRSPATPWAAATSWRCAPTSACSARRRRSASRRSCSASSPVPAAPSGWPAWSARPGQGPRVHRPARGCGGGAGDRPGRRRRPRRRGVRDRRRDGAQVRRRAAAGPGRRQARDRRGARRCRWTRGWSWRAGCSPSCSTPRTRRPACARSWRAARARRSSPAAEPGTQAAGGRSVGEVLVLPRAPAVCTRCRDQEHTVGRSGPARSGIPCPPHRPPSSPPRTHPPTGLRQCPHPLSAHDAISLRFCRATRTATSAWMCLPDVLTAVDA